MEERGSGDTIKKEDEFDFIGGFKLYERLRKMYKYTNVTGHIIAYYNDSGLITVPLFVDKGMNIFNIDYFVNSGKVSIYARWYNDARKIFMKLSKKYHIYHPNVSIYHIEPFEGDVTNTFFTEVVDFILSCVEPPYKKVIERKDPVSESIWDDMQDRGTGDVEKEEDNIDLFDVKTLGEYVKKIYKPDHLITADSSGITLNMGWCFFPKVDYKITLSWPEALPMVKKLYVYGSKKFIDSLDSVYDINHPGHYEGQVLGYSVEKNHPKQLSNKFFIQFVDSIIGILENDTQIEKGVVRVEDHKEVSESIWSDMQERGTGDAVKKEDDVNIMEPDRLCKYINKTYNCLLDDERLYSSTYSISMPIFYDKNENITYINLRLDDPRRVTCSYNIKNLPNLFSKLNEAYYVMRPEEWGDKWFEIYPLEYEKLNSLPAVENSFYLGIIDFILENVGDEVTKIYEKI